VPPAPQPSAHCGPTFPDSKWCASSSPNLPSDDHSTKTAAACCDLCSATDKCEGWAWGKTHNLKTGNHSCHLKSEIKVEQKGPGSNCTSACRIGGTRCLGASIAIKDLWQTKAPPATAYEGPAHGMNNTCQGPTKLPPAYPGGPPGNCQEGPLGSKNYDGYEDALFEEQLLGTIAAHDKDVPLFAFWAPHIVHAPLEVPEDYFRKFDFINTTDRDQHSRQLYHAMVNFADAAVGNVTKLLKAKGMWEDTLIFFSADNGGPIYNNGTAGANNYPLKGGKMNNWEGGIRVNGFVSGGFVPQSQRGTQYEGLTAGWDWYATFSAFAGVDPTDHRAALAGLPPIDSFDHSAMVMGTNLTSPRRELPIGTEPRPSNVSTAPLCTSYDGRTTYYGDNRMDGADMAELHTGSGAASKGKCTTVSGVIVDEGAGGLWKLLTGDVQQAVYTGPHYPNASTNEISNNFVGHCANGCLYNIAEDPLEQHDLAAAMPAKVAELYKKIEGYEATAFNPKRGGDNGTACKKALGEYGGFWGPFVN
jgi:hypothetical protein